MGHSLLRRLTDYLLLTCISAVVFYFGIKSTRAIGKFVREAQKRPEIASSIDGDETVVKGNLHSFEGGQSLRYHIRVADISGKYVPNFEFALNDWDLFKDPVLHRKLRALFGISFPERGKYFVHWGSSMTLIRLPSHKKIAIKNVQGDVVDVYDVLLALAKIHYVVRVSESTIQLANK